MVFSQKSISNLTWHRRKENIAFKLFSLFFLKAAELRALAA
jgi:hypothetical protein